eukprot:m.225363 g.225363  ORF g.225363 m.225363 type:complete len:402 (+) comp19205_c0_seq2:945-2150(+)
MPAVSSPRLVFKNTIRVSCMSDGKPMHSSAVDSARIVAPTARATGGADGPAAARGPVRGVDVMAVAPTPSVLVSPLHAVDRPSRLVPACATVRESERALSDCTKNLVKAHGVHSVSRNGLERLGGIVSGRVQNTWTAFASDTPATTSATDLGSPVSRISKAAHAGEIATAIPNKAAPEANALARFFSPLMISVIAALETVMNMGNMLPEMARSMRLARTIPRLPLSAFRYVSSLIKLQIIGPPTRRGRRPIRSDNRPRIGIAINSIADAFAVSVASVCAARAASPFIAWSTISGLAGIMNSQQKTLTACAYRIRCTKPSASGEGAVCSSTLGGILSSNFRSGSMMIECISTGMFTYGTTLVFRFMSSAVKRYSPCQQALQHKYSHVLSRGPRKLQGCLQAN